MLTAGGQAADGAGWPDGWELADAARWAWCSVNTRSVVMPAATTRRRGGASSAGAGSQGMGLAAGPEPRGRSREPEASLAPLLDLLNHCNEASVTAGYNTRSARYEIVTHDEYSAGDEVFIKYSDHSSEASTTLGFP